MKTVTFIWLPVGLRDTRPSQNEPLLNRLSRFYRLYERKGDGSAVFAKEAAALAERFGAALWTGERHASAYLSVAAYAVTHKRLYRALQADGTRGLRAEVRRRLEALRAREPISRVEVTGWYGGFPEMRYHETRGSLSPLERSELDALEQVAVMARGKTPRALRASLADALFNAFGGHFHLRRGRLLLQTFGIQAECAVEVWAGYLLSQMWRGGLSPLVCEGCGALFTPHDERQRYCIPGSGCAQRKRRRTGA